MKDYYTNIIEEINKLIKSKKYDEAFIIIKEELSMPYIPVDFELYLNQNLKIIQQNKTSYKKDLSIDKIFKYLKKDNNDLKTDSILKLNYFNLHLYLDDIKYLLKSSKLKNKDKTILLFVLKNQKINLDFSVQYKDNIIKINPYQIKDINDVAIFKNIILKIKNKIDQNPSLIKICLNLIEDYFYFYFYDWNIENVDIDSFIMAIIMCSENMLCIEKEYKNNYKDKKSLKYIEKIKYIYIL